MKVLARGAAALLAAAGAMAAGPARAQVDVQSLFAEMDGNRDGFIDREEFSMNKGAIFYALDRNRDLKVEQDETALSPEAFQKYAGTDGVLDGLEIYDVPQTRFEAFDRDGNRKIGMQEFLDHIMALRGERLGR